MKKLIVMVFGLMIAGCGERAESPKTGQSTIQEMEQTEETQQKLIKIVPIPSLKDSLERRNAKAFLEYWNNPNRLSYIYLISDNGVVIAHYVIKGKVTSTQSRLTTQQQVLSVRRKGDWDPVDRSSFEQHVVESPNLDGSYGPSEEGIYFFTVDNPGVPVVWNGKYLVSGVPMQLSTQPVLFREVKK